MSCATKNIVSTIYIITLQSMYHYIYIYICFLLGGLEHFYFFPYIGNHFQLIIIFQRGWNHQPVYIYIWYQINFYSIYIYIHFSEGLKSPLLTTSAMARCTKWICQVPRKDGFRYLIFVSWLATECAHVVHVDFTRWNFGAKYQKPQFFLSYLSYRIYPIYPICLSVYLTVYLYYIYIYIYIYISTIFIFIYVSYLWVCLSTYLFVCMYISIYMYMQLCISYTWYIQCPPCLVYVYWLIPQTWSTCMYINTMY